MFSKRWRGRGGHDAEPRRPYVLVEGEPAPQIVRDRGRFLPGFYMKDGKVHRSKKRKAAQ